MALSRRKSRKAVRPVFSYFGTFVDVTWSRALPDWTMSHVRMFEYWGGVPELVIPDN